MAMKVKSAPMSMELAITSRCNLRCKYCSHFTSAGDVDKDLPLDEWLTLFEELNHIAVFNLTLQGGEPFFRKDWKRLVEGIVENQMRFDILSNGTLISDETASFLASTGRCDSVQVSIDGSIPITHDVFRGKGNFFKAVNGVKHLLKHDVTATVRVTIHRHNVRDLPDIAKLLLEDIGLGGFSTNAASYMGLCRQNTDMIQLTIEERSLAMKSLLELNQKYEGRISATAGPLADGKTWLQMEKARREGVEYFPGGGCLSACGGVMDKLAIRADGVIVPCIQMSHISLGRINKERIREIWHNHPELKRLRERSQIPLKDFEFCKGCDYINYCTGNCPALAYLITENDCHPSPEACLRMFLQEGGTLPDEELLMKY